MTVDIEELRRLESEARVYRGTLRRLQEWDMLSEGSWLADAPWARGLIDAALHGDEPTADVVACAAREPMPAAQPWRPHDQDWPFERGVRYRLEKAEGVVEAAREYRRDVLAPGTDPVDSNWVTSLMAWDELIEALADYDEAQP